MGGLARRPATTSVDGGSDAAAVAQRSHLAGGSRRYLFAAVAPARALCRGDARSLQGDPAVPWRRGWKSPLYHRRRRFGRGRQIDVIAGHADVVVALAEHTEGRTHHHRWVSLSERPPQKRRSAREEGFSGKLRRHKTHMLSLRCKSWQAQCPSAGLFACDLRCDPRREHHCRSPGYPYRRGSERPPAQSPRAGWAGHSFCLRFLRFFGLSARRGKRSRKVVHLPLHAPARYRLSEPFVLFQEIRRPRRPPGGSDRARNLDKNQFSQSARKHSADDAPREPRVDQGAKPHHRGSRATEALGEVAALLLISSRHMRLLLAPARC